MLKSLEGIKAIIFDMDGVLFLSSKAHETAFRRSLADLNIQDLSYPRIAGMRTDEAFQIVLTEAGLELSKAQLEKLVKNKRQFALEAFETEAEVTEDGRRLVDAIRPHYRLALASSGSPQSVAHFLSSSGYGEAFEFCLDGSLVERAKPAPDIYHLALEKLALPAEACLVIEDSQSGVIAAKDAGLRVIGLAGTDAATVLLAAGASDVVASLLELEPHLLAKIQ